MRMHECSFCEVSLMPCQFMHPFLWLCFLSPSTPPALPLPSACRAGLGLGGVLIVAASVLGSLGLCSWAGMSATLIIMEVIPFLVLAGAAVAVVGLWCSCKGCAYGH
jgi:Niemann-Pick C1 protein